MRDDRFRGRYRVASTRLDGWDYRWAGVYAVAIRVLRCPLALSDIAGGRVTLSSIGNIVGQEWERIPGRHPHVWLDRWVVMPDHLHGILIFEQGMANGPVPKSRLLANSLGAVLGQFKSKTTKRIRALGLDFDWQPRYYDQILPNATALESMRSYIERNPWNWNPDDNL